MADENHQPPKPSEELPAGESTPILPRTYGQFLGGNSGTASKTEWPELVGLTAEEAEKKIKEDKPGAQIQVVPSDCFVTMDFRESRVRLFVDSSGKIERPPRCG